VPVLVRAAVASLVLRFTAAESAQDPHAPDGIDDLVGKLARGR
jgi:hypothetical protein